MFLNRNYSRVGLLLLGSSLLLPLNAHAEDYDELEERIDRIEERLQQGSAANMLGDIQALQAEVRELRGEIERLQYEAEQQRIRQRDMNLDIEKRLTALEKGGPRSATPITSPQAQAPAPAVSTPPPVVPPTVGTNPPAVSNPLPASAGETGNTSTSPGLAPPPQPQPTGQAPVEATAPPSPAVTLNEQDEYLKAFELLKQGSYDQAITAFQGFLKNFPAGNYADNAYYWLAETYYVKRDYQPSLQSFNRLLAQHPNSSKLPGALLKIGYIQYELGNNAEARIALERVRNEFAGSNVATLATQRLERMDREGR